MFASVILNDKDKEQNHAQSKDIQLDAVQNSTIDVDASAADLLHAPSGDLFWLTGLSSASSAPYEGVPSESEFILFPTNLPCDLTWRLTGLEFV